MEQALKSPAQADPISPKSERTQPRWAPIRVPPQRRLQTMAVIFWTIQHSLCISVFCFLMSMPIFWPALIPYVIWIFFDQAPEKGGRKIESVRQWKVWKLLASYFPVSLIKTADLPSDRKYVFGYHPHGIIGVGALANFATDDVANNRGEGNCLVIVIGGASEALTAHPGTADLVLKRRLGFIKLAIREGADLVPVFSFGENDVYAQLSNAKGTYLYVLQKKFQAAFGFTLPIFHGRGVFNYSLGILPYRHPIVSIVGKPIRLEQNKNPTPAEVEEVQRRYIAELTHVWDTYKDVYAPHRKRELTLVD